MGEQSVRLEGFSGDLLAHSRFKTPAGARESGAAIDAVFVAT